MNRLLFTYLLLAPMLGFCSDEVKKKLNAVRLAEPPRIDGVLDDAAWATAEIATDFLQNRPNPGAQASQKTEVRVIYDDEAIYIGATLFDTASDSILHQLSARDELENTDYFGIMLSCFQDGINAFEFITTPDGVQFDAQVSTYGEDPNWNAVWQCNTSITADGWIAEFKIPYSALRFPEKEVQTWDVNFFRTIRRLREQSFWQFVDPQVMGFVNQSGELTGLENIKPPVRIFFYPYASGYVEFQGNDDGSTSTGFSYNGGMDVKVGLSDAFTLDMTLIPDFGQVQSDNQVLNLSPFEVRFDENRQFFTEGTELFNKAGVFYSRRIGGTPVNLWNTWDDLDSNEVVEQFPVTTQLLNATKVSGRTSRGLGIGVFNAVTGREYATIKDTLTGDSRRYEVSPLVNYNIIALDQNLPNNSYFTLINTNVMRDGSVYDANVTATEFSLRNKSNVLEIEGGGAYNKKFNWGDNDTDDGYAYNLGINKISGTLTYGIAANVESKYYDPNDLGFLSSPNELSSYIWLNYNRYEPFGKFNNMWSGASWWVDGLHTPSVYTGWGMNYYVGFNTRKFFSFGMSLNSSLSESYDYFEPRVDGRKFIRPAYVMGNVWISSDYRKPLAIDVNVELSKRDEVGWWSLYWRVAPRVRVNDKLSFNYVFSHGLRTAERGWVNLTDDDQTVVGDDIIFSERNVNTFTNVLSANYIFTNRMGLTFRLRHYWSYVDVQQFFVLDDAGYTVPTNFTAIDDEGTSIYDQSFNAFNIDMVYTWVFSPGSQLSVVWKNSIIGFSEEIPRGLIDDFSYTMDLPQRNSISIKALYFVDYYSLTKKGRSGKIRN
ncbi:MAG: carbohydrate binding family 9 domain-containing protein [Flavobacteriales bacterium]|nr:carbohydrate binding family 9 domain-containing protein [Flavobacteriales bacterium]